MYNSTDIGQDNYHNPYSIYVKDWKGESDFKKIVVTVVSISKPINI